MSFGVYSMTFQTEHGEKVYIGSTAQTFEQRNYEHLSSLKRGRHCNKYLQRLWNKYQKFTFEIIEECTDPNNVTIREQWYIDHTDSEILINNGPARPSPRFGVPVSEETRKKQSESAKRRMSRPEEREQLILRATGKSPSEETRKKLSEASSKFYQTEQGRAFMSQIAKGRVVSEETREKLSRANRGKKPSPQALDGRKRYLQQRREQCKDQ